MAEQQPFNERLGRVRQQLKERNLDCLALIPGYNLRYLTGKHFLLLERAIVAFIPVESEPVLVLPALEVLNWQHGAPFEAQLFVWDDAEGPIEAMHKAARALPELPTIAVEQLRMRVLEYELVRSCFPNSRLAQAEAVMDPVRIAKAPEEIAALRHAIQITEAALEEVISGARPGVTERELSNRLITAMLLRGGEQVETEPLLLSGPKSALPHGMAADRPIEQGDIVLMDFGTAVNGYHSDITRTFVMGKASDHRLSDVYGVVQKANAAGRETIRPGITCQDVDEAVRAVIAAEGLGQYFTHRTGHGLGLDIHEPPSLVAGNEMRLDAGMVVTVEPGVYMDGWGGVRIEDDVVVTPEGCESLTTFGRELRVLGQ
jgi:Xaa-Pro dipeptidase